MKLFTITESYSWYKGADATSWGVFPSKKVALKKLKEILREKFHHILEDLFDGDEAEFNQWIQDRFANDKSSVAKWKNDDDESVTVFYIDEYDCPWAMLSSNK